MHKVTLLLGLLGVIVFVSNEIISRTRMLGQGIEVLPTHMFILKLAFISALIGGLAWILAGYQSLSWAAVVILIVVSSY